MAKKAKGRPPKKKPPPNKFNSSDNGWMRKMSIQTELWITETFKSKNEYDKTFQFQLVFTKPAPSQKGLFKDIWTFVTYQSSSWLKNKKM